MIRKMEATLKPISVGSALDRNYQRRRKVPPILPFRRSHGEDAFVEARMLLLGSLCPLGGELFLRRPGDLMCEIRGWITVL